MWSQTPQFTVLLEAPAGSNIEINVHHGVIQTFEAKNGGLSEDLTKEFRTALVGQKLQDIGDWTQFLQSRIEPWHNECGTIADRLDSLIPVPDFSQL